MKTFLKILGALFLLLILLVLGFYGWASYSTRRILSETHVAHNVDFPIPFPLSDSDKAARGLEGAAADSVALVEAVERGRHLVTARYVCGECHNPAFGGGVMVDAFPIGTLLGPNITLGKGSRTLNYTAKDWDHIVRHGILPDGRAAIMPSEDFKSMSDQELSDIIAYIRSAPPADNTVPKSKLGPLGKILVATGQIRTSVSIIGDHQSPHMKYPPMAAPTVEFGKHLAAICSGCHGADFRGGPIPGGDPAWPPSRNLTPHATGLAAWTYDDFVKALTTGTRRDGTPLRAPMTLMTKYADNMTPVEFQALWAYLRSLPPVDHAIP
ncbi:MAG TPA: cytochrome c [Fibrobacteria bacterium]|jgi:mono/diheme cytochrome c family protein|nr:cytochrome c [Fibrobacteria bacterium]